MKFKLKKRLPSTGSLLSSVVGNDENIKIFVGDGGFITAFVLDDDYALVSSDTIAYDSSYIATAYPYEGVVVRDGSGWAKIDN